MSFIFEDLYNQNSRQSAIDYPDMYMSIIMDGMAQIHSELPYMGNTANFSTKLTQHLQGILEHGYGDHVYRSFENLKNDSNLGVYCFLDVLEKR